MNLRTRQAFGAGAALVMLMNHLPASTIVAFGDSTTAERGSLKIYVSILQEELVLGGAPVRVVNAGVPSNTTADAKQRLESDVLSHRPDIVVIQFGLNDSAVDVWKSPPATAPRVSIEQYGDNLRDLIARCREAGARVILMTPNLMRWTPGLADQYGKPPYRPDEPDGFNVILRDYVQVVRQVAVEQNVELVDVFAQIDQAGTADRLLMDGMHPNELGHRLVADLLMNHLKAEKPAGSPAAPAQP